MPSAVQILWGRTSGLPEAGLVLLTLDAAISTEDEYNNKITPYPVETGLDVTDHVRQEPDEFKVEGIVSDTPDGIDSTDGDYSQSAYKALCAIAGRDYVTNETAVIQNEFPNPIMVDVISKYRIFTDMIMERFHAPRTKETGDSIHFSCSFKKIRKVNTSLANINYTSSRIVGQDGVDRSQSDVDQGKQQPGNPTDPLKKALGSAADTFGSWWNGDISTGQLLGG